MRIVLAFFCLLIFARDSAAQQVSSRKVTVVSKLTAIKRQTTTRKVNQWDAVPVGGEWRRALTSRGRSFEKSQWDCTPSADGYLTDCELFAAYPVAGRSAVPMALIRRIKAPADVVLDVRGGRAYLVVEITIGVPPGGEYSICPPGFCSG